MVSPEYDSYYAVIRAIPPGKVMTYGDVAAYAGRLINAKGEISRRTPDGISEEMQRDLLESEGVEFSLERQVHLARFRHRPESADD